MPFLPDQINSAADIFLPMMKMMLVIFFSVGIAGSIYDKIITPRRLLRQVATLRRQGR